MHSWTSTALVVSLAACACRSDRAAPPTDNGGATSTADPLAPCDGITHGAAIRQLRRGGMGMHGMGMHGMGTNGTIVDTWPDLDIWLLGAELPGAPAAPRPPVDDALRARGTELYARHCAICHGTRGDGKGPMAAMLASSPPQDFTTGVYKLRSTPPGSLPTDEDLFRTISRGIHGTTMIPWTDLSESDRWALVARLKAFSPDVADEPAPAPITVPSAPEQTPGLLARGKQLFETAGCASCHGVSGKGDGPGAAVLRDAAGRPVHPTDLTSRRYRRGALTSEIYVTVRTGLDGTPMASFANVLSPDDTWAVAAYVHSLAPPYVVTASGVACPAIASLDAWELEGARIAAMTMMPMGARMRRHMGW